MLINISLIILAWVLYSWKEYHTWRMGQLQTFARTRGEEAVVRELSDDPNFDIDTYRNFIDEIIASPHFWSYAIKHPIHVFIHLPVINLRLAFSDYDERVDELNKLEN